MTDAAQRQTQAEISPKISVVIASVNGAKYLEKCLESLARQDGDIAAEVIVADCCGPETEAMARERFPCVQFHSFPERKSVPDLRAFGMLRAKGDIIALTEDHCVAPRDWYRQMAEAHESDYALIGGAVENAATDRIIDWAVYFCEYLRFALPMDEFETFDLPGPNESYKREAIEDIRDLLERGLWENWLHERLREKGRKALTTPKVLMMHRKFFGFGEFVSQRFHYGRGYAGMRNETCSTAKRLVYIALSPALPPILLWRMFKVIRQKKRFYGLFAASLPLLALFTCVWAMGEWTGYVFGPGDSMLKVE